MAFHCLGDLQLTKQGYKDAIVAKISFIDALLTQFDIRLQNPTYRHLRVANYRLWKSSKPTQHETNQVVAKKCFAHSNPCIFGAHRFFGQAKQECFTIPQEQREGMQDAKSFIKFWQGVVVKKELHDPLQHYAAAIVLACCSSCDAQRSISLLNCIVTAQRKRMSWKSIRMHLIGAEDLNDVDYLYAQVAYAWATTPRRYKKHKARKTSQRKPGTCRDNRAKVLFDGGSDALAELDDDSSDFALDCSSANLLVTISSSSSNVSCSLDDSDTD